MRRTYGVLEVSSGKTKKGTNTNFIQRYSPIHFKSRAKGVRTYYFRLENIKIPISFYNITSSNNTLSGTITNGTTPVAFSFSVSAGNYTIDELIDEVELQLNNNAAYGETYTVERSSTTGQITISHTGGTATSITLDSASTILANLGFSTSQSLTSLGGSLTGENWAYTSSYNFLKIRIKNINSSNYFAPNKEIGGCEIKVPITTAKNNFEFYENDNGYELKMPELDFLSTLEVELTDENNNIMDLNEVPWSFEFVIYEYIREKKQ